MQSQNQSVEKQESNNKSSPNTKNQEQQDTEEVFVSTPALEAIVHHHHNFITMIHTDFYNTKDIQKPLSSYTKAHQQANKKQKFKSQQHSKPNVSTVSPQALIKFQVQWLTQLTDKFNSMVKQLNEGLITDKRVYDMVLRDHFHKVLCSEFLPLLRFSRYQITQISLYGFDIYISPLQTMLEILNRLDSPKEYLSQKLTKQKYCQISNILEDPISILEKGWDCYLIYLNLWRIQFNLYIFKQYLKVANKSLARKDKQIIFTGCNHLFDKLIPKLCQSQCIWILAQLAQLNNELYFFHPSYNLFQFYTHLLDPLKIEYEQLIFRKNLKIIAEKCQTTNIITPLLFGVMRNHNDFVSFIEQANNSVWNPYLKAILKGLLINVKARILQYDQIVTLIKAVMRKLAILGCDLSQLQIANDLGKQWDQAKQFFISAVKLGYNVGQLHTWHSCSPQLIQNQVQKQTIESLLVLPGLQQSKSGLFLLLNFLEQEKPADYLRRKVEQMSENRINFQSMMVQKSIINVPNLFGQRLKAQLKLKEVNYEDSILNMMRIINLHILCKKEDIFNEEKREWNLIACIASSLLRLKMYSRNQNIDNQSYRNLEKYIVEKLDTAIDRLNSEEITDYLYDAAYNAKILKIMLEFYNEWQPEGTFMVLANILLHSQNHCKDSLLTFLKILYNSRKGVQNSEEEIAKINKRSDIASALIISSYFNKDRSTESGSPFKSKKFSGSSDSNSPQKQQTRAPKKNIVVKTFQKQFTIPQQSIHLDSKQRFCINVLLEIYGERQLQNSRLKSHVLERIIKNIVRIHPSKGLAMLIFPITVQMNNNTSKDTQNGSQQILSNSLSPSKSLQQEFQNGESITLQAVSSSKKNQINQKGNQNVHTTVQPFSSYLLLHEQKSKNQLVMCILQKCYKSIKTSEKQSYIQKVTIPSFCNIMIKHINHLLLDKQKQQRTVQSLKILKKMYEMLELDNKQKQEILFGDIVKCYKFLIQRLNEEINVQSISQVQICFLKNCLRQCHSLLQKNIFKQSYSEFLLKMMRHNVTYHHIRTTGNAYQDQFNAFQNYQIDNLKEMQSAFCIEDYDHMQNSQQQLEQSSIRSPRFSSPRFTSDFSKTKINELLAKKLEIISWEDVLAKIQSQPNSKTKIVENLDLNNVPTNKWKTYVYQHSIQESAVVTTKTISDLKAYIMPVLSQNVISFLLKTQQREMVPQYFNVVLTNPRNAYLCLQWAVQNRRNDIISNIGITRMYLQQKQLMKLIACLKENNDIQQRTCLIQQITQNLTSAQRNCLAEYCILTYPDQDTFYFIVSIKEFRFLITRSQSNWRLFIDEILKQFADHPKFGNTKLVSTLMQYQQYLQITNCLNNEYTAILEQYRRHVQVYAELLSQRSLVIKQQAIFQLKNTDEEHAQMPQHVRLSILAEIANAKLILSIAKCKETLFKLGKFILQLKNRKMQNQQENLNVFMGIVEEYHKINNLFNSGFGISKVKSFINGHIVTPDFIYGNYYQNQAVVKSIDNNSDGLMLGKYLQAFESVFCQSNQFQTEQSKPVNNPSGIQMSNCLKYTPSLKKVVEWSEFKKYLGTVDLSLMRQPTVLTFKENQREDVQNECRILIKKLLQQKILISEFDVIKFAPNDANQLVVNVQESESQINHETMKQAISPNQQKIVVSSNQQLQDNYKAYLLGIMYKAVKKQYLMSELIVSMVKRQAISWQLLRQNHAVEYHHIKSILMNNKIREQNLPWVYQNEELVINGRQILITQGNKQAFCNILAIKTLGKEMILSQWFAKGVLYHQNETIA